MLIGCYQYVISMLLFIDCIFIYFYYRYIIDIQLSSITKYGKYFR
jgi:hypothetical protein